ncbi:Rz1-like lysis system protein LysC, partial [Xylella fastidiosa]
MCLTCLGACSTGTAVKPVIVTQTRVEVIIPPQVLLQPCEEPPLPRVETVRDVLNQTLGWR